MTIHRSINLPEVAEAGDRFVDEGDENKIWQATQSYRSDLRQGYLPMLYRQDGLYVSMAHQTVYASLSCVRAGGSGTSSLIAVGGSGTLESPLLFTMLAYDNDNSGARWTAISQENAHIRLFSASKVSYPVVEFSGWRIGNYAMAEIAGEHRPDGRGLIFRAIEHGNAGNNIEIELLYGGADGVNEIAFNGNGSRFSPFRFTATLYANDSSNDAVIALFSGFDEYVEVLELAVPSATNGSVPSLSPVRLDNGVGANWAPWAINIRYDAEPHKLTIDEDLDVEMPHALKDHLAEGLAYSLARARDGGDPQKAMMWKYEWDEAIRLAKKAKSRVMGRSNTLRIG
jgi:hypothetical protein